METSEPKMPAMRLRASRETRFPEAAARFYNGRLEAGLHGGPRAGRGPFFLMRSLISGLAGLELAFDLRPEARWSLADSRVRCRRHVEAKKKSSP